MLFHSPYLTVCISFDTVTSFVFWIMQEKRIYECPVIHKSCINITTFRVWKTDVQDSFLQIIEMFYQFIFSNQVMSFFQMERLKILLKIDFFFWRKADVFLKLHLLDSFFNEFSYLSRCHKFIKWHGSAMPNEGVVSPL